MTYLQRFTARLKAFLRWLKLFFCGDPYPQTPATQSAARVAQQADRDRWNVDEDGKVRRLHGICEIHKATRDNMLQFNSKRRQELDATVDTVTTLTRERIH